MQWRTAREQRSNAGAKPVGFPELPYREEPRGPRRGRLAEAMHGIPAHLVATARVRAHFLTQAPDLVDVIKRLYSASETAGDGDTVNTLTRSES